MNIVHFKNKPGACILTDDQVNCLALGDYIGSGLDLDTYMSLKDAGWPVE